MFCDCGNEPTDYVTEMAVSGHKGDYLIPRKDPAPWN